MRCFIALELSAHAKKALTEISRALSGRLPGARWVRADSLHITLAFLGDIDGPALECAHWATDASAGMGCFDLRFGGLLCLPERGRAHVLAARVDLGANECGRACKLVNSSLAQAARERGLGKLNPEWPGGRPFMAHVTLARSGEAPIPREIEDAWTEIAAPPQAPYRVSRCILYKSVLGRGGAQYDPVKVVEL